MALESYGCVGNWSSLEHFFYESEMTRHLYNQVEYPGLILAIEQEKILKSMVNQGYRFQLYIERNSPKAVIGSDVIYVQLVFEDQMTKTEYELLK